MLAELDQPARDTHSLGDFGKERAACTRIARDQSSSAVCGATALRGREAVGFLVRGHRNVGNSATSAVAPAAADTRGTPRRLAECAGDLLEKFGADRDDDDDVRARSARSRATLSIDCRAEIENPEAPRS